MTGAAKFNDSPWDKLTANKQKHKHIIIRAIVEKYKLIIKPISTKFSPMFLCTNNYLWAIIERVKWFVTRLYKKREPSRSWRLDHLESFDQRMIVRSLLLKLELARSLYSKVGIEKRHFRPVPDKLPTTRNRALFSSFKRVLSFCNVSISYNNKKTRVRGWNVNVWTRNGT